MEDKEESKMKKKEQTAEEVAKIMVENMKANMNNPNFWAEREELKQKVVDDILKKRKERQKEND